MIDDEHNAYQKMMFRKINHLEKSIKIFDRKLNYSIMFVSILAWIAIAIHFFEVY